MDYRSITVDTKKTPVPGLHPGLNDLIRVLGKQAHCASRTLIVCEPVCPKPSYSESKYHKNCGSPKKGRSWDSLCRPSSLWSPVRPETYYYDCFFYRQYPDRDSEYQEIEDKYNAIKQQKLDYSPPECDEDRIKAIVSGESLRKAGGGRYTGLADGSKSSAGKGARYGKPGGTSDGLSGPGAFKNKDNNLGESSMGSHRSQKYPLGSSSKRNMVSDGDSVPCAELAEIRDLLKKNDRETIRRMQEMLTLMKELSVRDICRATCDGPPAGGLKTGGTRSSKSEEDMPDESKRRMEQRNESRKRKVGDFSNYGHQDKKKRNQQSGKSDGYDPESSTKNYQQREGEYGPTGGAKQEDDGDEDFWSQGRNRSYQQRDDDYGVTGPMESYQQRDDIQGPRESKKSYQLHNDSSRRRKGEYDGVDDNGDYYDVERQESETAYPQGKSTKRRKRGADDEGQASMKNSQQRGTGRKRKKEYDDDGAPAEGEEENGGDYAEPPLDLDNEEPHSLQRNLVSRGKFDAEHESLSSTSDSERSGTSTKKEQPSPRRWKGKIRNAVSESDTDLTESSSLYSESLTTDTSQGGEDGEPDYESSDTESNAPDKTASSSSVSKRCEDGSMPSSQASISVQRSASSLGKTHREDRSRPGLYQGQKSPKQSMGPGKAATSPDQPSPGANYKIPVGKKNVPLTVHEVVELSNKITDIIVLEIIDELIRNGLYVPPNSRYLREPGATMPRTSVESDMKSKSSRQKLNEQKGFDDPRESSGYKVFSEEERMKSAQSPSRLSRIDESSSRAGLSKGSSRRNGSVQDTKKGEKRPSGESRRSSCPRHSKSLSPSTSSRRRSSACRLEIQRRARSEGDHYDDLTRPRGDIVPPKPWERRLSSQLKAEMMDSSKASDQGRTVIPGSRGASVSSQRSKSGSYKTPSTQVVQASLKDSSVDRSLSERQPTLPGSSQKISSTQYAVPPRDRSNVHGSRGASVCSQMSKTGSQKVSSARPDQASLKDGSLSGQQSTLPGSRPNVLANSPRSSKQYEATVRDRPGVSESRRASMSSKISKTGSYRVPSTQPDQSSLKDSSLAGRSMYGSRRGSMSSQMNKRSDGNRPPYGPDKPDSHQRDVDKNWSLSGDRIEAPSGPGTVPSGPRIPKDASKGILKDSSVPDSSQMRTRIEDQCGPGQDINSAGEDPSGSRIPTARQQPDNTSSQRVVDQGIINAPNRMGEEEVSKGKLVIIRTKENIYTPESGRTDTSAMRGTFQQSSAAFQPCQPDEFIATDYDTDNSVLYYARITSNAFPPVKETYHAAGFMLRSAYNYSIPPRSKMSIKTDLLLQLPRNSYGRMAPRKCLVENYGIDVVADVIDRDFRGNITVVLFNHGDNTFTVERGNKVAQLICESIHLAKVVENSNLLK